MNSISGLLKELPYKICKNNIGYYLVISKCYKGYMVRYWDYDTKILIRQEYNTLTGCLLKTKLAVSILKEQKEIK